MQESHEPIPLENIIQILAIYREKLEECEDCNGDIAKLLHVFAWCKKYLEAYQEGLNFPRRL